MTKKAKTGMNNPKIGIIGLGMVGSPILRYFEEFKNYKRSEDIFCYDVDSQKGFSDDISLADIVFICVPTPSLKKGQYDLSMVEAALKMLKKGRIAVVKSTVPPATTEKLQKDFPHLKIVFNPEFLTESQAWYDFLRPDRQIIGYTQKSIDASHAVLSLLPQAPFMAPWGCDCYQTHRVSSTEAEMGKIAANVFGALKVSFANILADLSSALKIYFEKKGIKGDIDYDNVRKIISADHRIGGSWMSVTQGNYCGFGGYCFPKDFRGFVGFMEELIDVLKKEKKAADTLILLEKGKAALEAVWDYNKTLLELQNLKLEDVCRHDKSIVLEKRKLIR